MNGFLIPANAKKGTLIFNIFRPFDLILFCSGAFVSLILLTVISTTNIIAVLLALMPGFICCLLVFPIPNYHNTLCALISIYNFYTKRRKYVWKGWCFNEQFTRDDETEKSKRSIANK